MAFTYLACLVVSIAGLAAVDLRYRLVLWCDRIAGAVSLATGVVALLIWDLVCVSLGVFVVAPSPWATGWMALPGIPIEEPFFLLLLSYTVLIVAAVLARFRARGRE